MRITSILTFLISICALHSGAQTLTATYVALADSADNYMRHERWQDAERVIIRALRHEPANRSNYLLWSNLSLVRSEQQDYQGAIEACDIGLASAPRSTALLTNRARACLGAGKTAEAMSDLDLALEVDSTLLWPRKIRGIIRASEGNNAGAKSDLSIYLKSSPEDTDAIETLGDIAVRDNDPEEAFTHYKEAYRLQPAEGVLMKLLLTAHAYGRLDEQKEILREGMVKFPMNGNLYVFRALLHRKNYDTIAAEKDMKTAEKLKADPQLLRMLTESEKLSTGRTKP